MVIFTQLLKALEQSPVLVMLIGLVVILYWRTVVILTLGSAVGLLLVGLLVILSR